MAWCRQEPSHCLIQCWLMICEVLWNAPKVKFTEKAYDINDWYGFENYSFEIAAAAPGGKELNKKDSFNVSNTAVRCLISIMASDSTLTCRIHFTWCHGVTKSALKSHLTILWWTWLADKVTSHGYNVLVFHTSRSEQNRQYFADDIFKWNSRNKH